MDADKRGNLFKELNVDLRMLPTTTGDDHKCLKALWAPLIKNILSGMAKLPKMVPKHIKAYRGRPESMRDLRAIYLAGRLVTWSAFTSCSTRLDNAAYMANWDQGCVLQLSLSDVVNIKGLSFFPNEEEVLLPPEQQVAGGCGDGRRKCHRRRRPAVPGEDHHLAAGGGRGAAAHLLSRRASPFVAFPPARPHPRASSRSPPRASRVPPHALRRVPPHALCCAPPPRRYRATPFLARCGITGRKSYRSVPLEAEAPHSRECQPKRGEASREVEKGDGRGVMG